MKSKKWKKKKTLALQFESTLLSEDRITDKKIRIYCTKWNYGEENCRAKKKKKLHTQLEFTAFAGNGNGEDNCSAKKKNVFFPHKIRICYIGITEDKFKKFTQRPVDSTKKIEIQYK